MPNHPAAPAASRPSSIVEACIKHVHRSFGNSASPFFLGRLLQAHSPALPAMRDLDAGAKLPLLKKELDKNRFGNAQLTLTDLQLTGFESLMPKDVPVVEKNGRLYTAQLRLEFAGPVVPARPGIDFSNEDMVAGPLSLAGIADFPGIRVTGAFRCAQPMQGREPVEAAGRFLATLNPLEVSLAVAFDFPPADGAELSLSVTALDFVPPQEADLTITLLRPNGTLPEYRMLEIDPDDDEGNNFYAAQELINFPPRKESSLRHLVLEKLRSQFASQQPGIRQAVEMAASSMAREFLS
ncbi:MAG: hypothetical protein JWP58_2056 [Hymenobacter sp.]|nr:hypothetical protein [Hymenobacter sp.]